MILSPTPGVAGCSLPERDLSEEARAEGGCGVIAIGGSAGSIPALFAVLSALPPDFPVPLVVAVHLSRSMPSRLAEVLSCRSRLPVRWATAGETLRPATVHVLPRSQPLVLTAKGFAQGVSRAEPWVPSVDGLFTSAAASFGSKMIAVVLSGMMSDGALGTAAVRRAGGLTIAQDEASSDVFEMPAAAIDFGKAEMILAPHKIAEALLLAAESHLLAA